MSGRIVLQGLAALLVLATVVGTFYFFAIALAAIGAVIGVAILGILAIWAVYSVLKDHLLFKYHRWRARRQHQKQAKKA
jgi:hypothetical protein